MEGEATRLGISYEELLKRLEPTEVQKLATAEKRNQEMQKELDRLNAVRTAYWAASQMDSHDFDPLHDSLLQLEGVESPTEHQQKVLFFLLPQDIIGSGIAWGFADSEVRDSIYAFVREQMPKITEALRSDPSPKSP